MDKSAANVCAYCACATHVQFKSFVCNLSSMFYGGMEGSYRDVCIVKQRYDFNFWDHKSEIEIISGILRFILLKRSFHTTVERSTSAIAIFFIHTQISLAWVQMMNVLSVLVYFFYSKKMGASTEQSKSELVNEYLQAEITDTGKCKFFFFYVEMFFHFYQVQ